MKQIKNNLWKYTLYTFLISLAFSRAIFMLFLKDKGFTTAQMGLLESVLFVASFVMEIPTGILGDRIGRKWSVACGILAEIGSSLIFITQPDFAWMVIAFLLTGTGFAFISGSDRALYYDSLKALGKEGEYLKRKSRLNAISVSSLGLAMIVGGWMRRFGWSTVYWMEIAAALVNLALVLSFKEVRLGENREVSDAERMLQKNSMRQALNYFMKERKSRLLILFMVGIGLYGAFNTPFSIYNQLLLDFHGFAANEVALIKGLATFFAAGLVWFAGSFLEKKDPHRVLISLMGLSLALLLFELSGLPWVAVVVYLLIDGFAELAYVVSDNFSQEGIPSSIRASMLSAFSFFESVFVAIVYTLWGFLLERVEPPLAITGLGIFVVFAVLVLFRHRRLS
ncbi:MAG: MFS transporter [Anaerolineaceae bacterium]|nr:MFS transporter [Anaerolineaceae bacterium]